MRSHRTLAGNAPCSCCRRACRGDGLRIPQSTAKEKEADEKGKVVAVIETTLGTIEAELYSADAPKTVENFVGLAGAKYFDGVIFHRVVPGFVIQGGTPQDRDGGEEHLGDGVPDELNPATGSYKRVRESVLAMANRGPNTNTSQFFIMLGQHDSPQEIHDIRQRVKGIEVVDAIGGVALTGGWPGRVEACHARRDEKSLDPAGTVSGSGTGEEGLTRVAKDAFDFDGAVRVARSRYGGAGVPPLRGRGSAG